MVDLIKSLIAIAFIACAFWIGKYISEEKYTNLLKEVNVKYEANKIQIQQLEDSISIIKKELEVEKLSNNSVRRVR